MHCPNCKNKNLGKIGVNQFYCWDCFIELTLADGLLSLNQVEEDGSLTTLDDVFGDQERRIGF